MTGWARPTQGARAVETLGEAPLGLVQLICSAGDVVAGSVPQDVVHGVRLGHVLACLSDHDRELRLVVAAVVDLGEERQNGRLRPGVSQRRVGLPGAHMASAGTTCILTGQRARGLQEHGRDIGQGNADFLRVLDILPAGPSQLRSFPEGMSPRVQVRAAHVQSDAADGADFFG